MRLGEKTYTGPDMMGVVVVVVEEGGVVIDEVVLVGWIGTEAASLLQMHRK